MPFPLPLPCDLSTSDNESELSTLLTFELHQIRLVVALSVKNQDKSNNLHCHLVADAADFVAVANCLRYVTSLTGKKDVSRRTV